MTIAVIATRDSVNEAAGWHFFNQVMAHLVRWKSQHQFYILTNQPDKISVQAINVAIVAASYVGRKQIPLRMLQLFRHTRLLKKIGADVVFYINAAAFIKSRLPSCVFESRVINNAAKPLKNKNTAALRHLEKVLKETNVIVTVSETNRRNLQQQFNFPKQNIQVVYAGMSEDAQPIDYFLQSAIKDKYTQGKEFFMYAGSFENEKLLVQLLKAFSVFKKRQKTSWKLVLLNRSAGSNEDFVAMLKTYKYRNDIVLFHSDLEISSLLGAAYAFVYPVLDDTYGGYVLDAMACAIPVILADNVILNDMAGDAAMYCTGEVADIADKMMLLYKDEKIRNQLISRGKELALKYTWHTTAEGIWRSIQQAVNKGIV